MHLPFFCKSLSECKYTFGITITVLKISQNNDNRGRHLEFYSHTGIGNWFKCFPVYRGLNLSSGSGSRFRILIFPYARKIMFFSNSSSLISAIEVGFLSNGINRGIFICLVIPIFDFVLDQSLCCQGFQCWQYRFGLWQFGWLFNRLFYFSCCQLD